MDITPVLPADALVVNGYGDDYFLINGKRVQGSIYLYQAKYGSWDEQKSLEEIIEQFIIKPEIILIGQGRGCFKPSRTLQAQLSLIGVAVDFMDTPSACRTYNILLAEGREVCVFLKA